MQSDKVLNLPAGYFGIVLGTIGMGFAALCQPFGRSATGWGWAGDSGDDHLGIIDWRIYYPTHTLSA